MLETLITTSFWQTFASTGFWIAVTMFGTVVGIYDVCLKPYVSRWILLRRARTIATATARKSGVRIGVVAGLAGATIIAGEEILHHHDELDSIASAEGLGDGIGAGDVVVDAGHPADAAEWAMLDLPPIEAATDTGDVISTVGEFLGMGG